MLLWLFALMVALSLFTSGVLAADSRLPLQLSGRSAKSGKTWKYRGVVLTGILISTTLSTFSYFSELWSDVPVFLIALWLITQAALCIVGVRLLSSSSLNPLPVKTGVIICYVNGTFFLTLLIAGLMFLLTEGNFD